MAGARYRLSVNASLDALAYIMAGACHQFSADIFPGCFMTLTCLWQMSGILLKHLNLYHYCNGMASWIRSRFEMFLWVITWVTCLVQLHCMRLALGYCLLLSVVAEAISSLGYSDGYQDSIRFDVYWHGDLPCRFTMHDMFGIFYLMDRLWLSIPLFIPGCWLGRDALYRGSAYYGGYAWQLCYMTGWRFFFEEAMSLVIWSTQTAWRRLGLPMIFINYTFIIVIIFNSYNIITFI